MGVVQAPESKIISCHNNILKVVIDDSKLNGRSYTW